MLIPVLMLSSWLIQWILLLPVILTISPPNPRNPVDTREKLLNVAVINFCGSVMDKKADLLELISNQKPYIIIVGTETWLSPDVSNNEMIPSDLNTIFIEMIVQMVMVV